MVAVAGSVTNIRPWMEMDLDDEISYDVFKGAVEIKGLSTINNLSEALAKFGYSPDDVVGRREQILMYRKIESAFENRIAYLSRMRRYDEAKSRRRTLDKLLESFKKIQKDDMKRSHDQQEKLMGRAEKVGTSKMVARHQKDKSIIQAVCKLEEKYLAKKHDFQTENLERTIAATVMPKMKCNPRLQYLKMAEKNLTRLMQYDDARNVANMIAKLEPIEERRHKWRFNKSVKDKRAKLQNNQEEERRRLLEYMTALKWRGIRRSELESKIERQRLRNLTWDMTHYHKLESSKAVEMGLNPSALLQKRTGYDATGSGLRGRQTLDAIHGKKRDDAIFVAPLTEIHDFDNPPLDTVELSAETY